MNEISHSQSNYLGQYVMPHSDSLYNRFELISLCHSHYIGLDVTLHRNGSMNSYVKIIRVSAYKYCQISACDWYLTIISIKKAW